MADFNAISDVTETLRAILDASLQTLQPTPATCQVHDLTTAIGTSTAPVVLLALYDVVEDPSARNRPNERSVDPITSRIITRRPPATLLLRYLITPWTGNPTSDQQALGRAIQTLYENAVISGPDLVGSLQTSGEAVHVTMVPLSLEDRTHVWRSVNSNYRISANYEVRVVHLDTALERASAPVISRRARYFDRGDS